ncbi:MAG: homocysteine S-methyltransferase family protein [Actinomycetota bacterium]
MAKGILERLAEGPVVGDGGYLLELEKRGYVQAGPFTPEVSITHPSALLELHREFLYAGADVLQALTFYASEEKLATVGLGDKVDEINKAATAVAREAALEGDALVAGNLTLTWSYDPADPATADSVREQFDRQLADQMALGIDFVICETYSYIGEAIIATEQAKKTGLPVMTTMSFTKLPHAEEGDSAAECAKKLIDAGADIVGVNCLRPPEFMLPLVQEMREAVPGAFVAAQPVAYRVPADSPDFTSTPQFPYELDELQQTRKDFQDYARKALDMGVNYIGACCGAVAEHVRAVAKVAGKLPSEEREWKSKTGKAMSGYEYYEHTEKELD